MTTLPDRAPHDVHLRRRRHRQLRPVPPAAPGPGLADAAWPTRSTIDPEPADLFRHTDLYGNTKSYFHVVQPHTAADGHRDQRGRGRTGRARPGRRWPCPGSRPGRAVASDDPDAWEATDFTFPSPYVEIPPGIREYARASFTARPADRRGGRRPDAPGVRRLHLQVRLDHGQHQGRRPAAEPHRGLPGLLPLHGLRAARRSGWPAATSAATWPPARRPASRGWSAPTPATPGWAAGCPGAGWLYLDPTNNRLIDESHATVAWGRDYGDVPPVKGVIFTEAKKSKMKVSRRHGPAGLSLAPRCVTGCVKTAPVGAPCGVSSPARPG